MIIAALPTKWGRFFWENFSAIAIRVCFRGMEFSGPVSPDPSRSMLMVGNHISWWDGFWPMILNKKLFGKKYHVMMLEAELSKRPFMRRGGAFSINPGNRSMVESLRYTAGLLENPENMVLMYPQGKIHSVYESTFEFQPGIEKIIGVCRKPVQVVFFASLLDYGSFPLPTLRMYMEEYTGEPAAAVISGAYTRFYLNALALQKQAVPVPS
ncbi:MAG: lysophospholipid acyltransferase family protein [Bacteroidia bacterium]